MSCDLYIAMGHTIMQCTAHAIFYCFLFHPVRVRVRLAFVLMSFRWHSATCDTCCCLAMDK